MMIQTEISKSQTKPKIAIDFVSLDNRKIFNNMKMYFCMQIPNTGHSVADLVPIKMDHKKGSL